jgi:two-component system OmpR family response regulator
MAAPWRDAAEQALTSGSAFSAPSGSDGRLCAVKLLVVEDDEKIGNAVARGLRAEGFTVELVADGDEGLWRAQEGSYDLVILDIMLPGTNGYRICSTLRAQDDWTPILMLTAKDGDLDEAEGLDTGADDYLTKPFSFPVLVARVKALLRRAGGRDPVSLEVGDLRLDPAGRRAFRGDVEVPLTTRELDVLEFFVRRPEIVLSKEDVLAGVWEFEFDGDPNIVEVYVGRLRRKLDEAPGTTAIETVRGAGYRLVAG